MLMFRGFFPKSYIHQKNDNRQKRIHYKNIIADITKIYHFFESSLNFLTRIKNRIPRESLLVNANISSVVFKGINIGSIKTITSSADARSTNKSDKISNHT